MNKKISSNFSYFFFFFFFYYQKYIGTRRMEKGNDPTKIYIWIFNKKNLYPSPPLDLFFFFYITRIRVRKAFEQIEFFKLVFFPSLCSCYKKYFVRFNRAIYHDGVNSFKIYVILKSMESVISAYRRSVIKMVLADWRSAR